MTKSEIRQTIKEAGFPKDEETLSVYFLALYGRDFDHDEDGYYTGKDTANNDTLALAVKAGLR